MKNQILNLKALTNLEYLSLSYCSIRKDMFIGLDNLIGLKLYKCCIFYYTLCQNYDVFKGLSGLKTLYLSLIAEMNSLLIHPEEFINTSMLTNLKFSGNRCTLDENTFSHLKHLKTIEFDKSELNFIDSNVLDTLRRSNVEIIIQ